MDNIPRSPGTNKPFTPPITVPQRHIVPRLAPLLTGEELDAIHSGALQVLETVGLVVRSPRLRELLIGRAGLTFRGERLLFAPWLVEKHVDDYRADRPARPDPAEPEEILLETGHVGRFVVDLETDAVRPATWDDAVLAVKLAESMRPEGVVPSVPCVPQDVPPQMGALAEYLIGARHSRNGGCFVSACSLAGLEYIYRMHQVLEQPFELPLYISSPLQVDADSLAAVLHFLDRADSFRVASMPMRGMSAPIFLAGSFVQSVAESLAGLVIIKEIATGVPVHFSVLSFAFDMKEATILYGAPEMNLADMVKREVSAYYGMRDISTHSIRSMAKRPGVQAVAEKAASAMSGALTGSRRFYGGGQLSIDEVFSAEQLVVDREITDYVQRMVGGFDVGSGYLSVDIIREAVAEPDGFLVHPSTLAHHRQLVWRPRVFQYSMLRAWQNRGEPGARAAARARVWENLARYDFHLPAEKDKELTALYESGWQKLVGCQR